MFTIVFVEPETPGNIGALARAMKNFGFTQLVLVNPKCDLKHPEIQGRAMHALDIVQKARVVKTLDAAVKNAALVVGTTGKTTRSYDPKRASITPRELTKKTAGLQNKEITL